MSMCLTNKKGICIPAVKYNVKKYVILQDSRFKKTKETHREITGPFVEGHVIL